MSYLERWIPPPHLTGHTGKSIEEDEIFFVAPPIEIGEVLSASSRAKRGKPLGLPLPIRILFVTAAAAITWWAFSWLLANSTNDADNQKVVNTIYAYLMPVLIGIAAISVTSKKTLIYYVGKEGVVRAAYPVDHGRFRRGEVLLFRDGRELKKRETNQFNHGFYDATIFKFVWLDHSHSPLFAIRGRARISRVLKGALHDYEFAIAAEKAWENYRLSQSHTYGKEESVTP